MKVRSDGRSKAGGGEQSAAPQRDCRRRLSALLAEPEKPSAFADALSRILDQSIDRQQLGQRARQRVETHFTAERMAAATVTFYEEACGQISDLRSLA